MDLFDFDFTKSDGQKSKLIFFDTETTGNGDDDEIIEIGAIIEDIDSSSFEPYDELCSANKLISLEAMAVHGIRNEDIEGKITFEKSKFFKRIKELNSISNYLIAHNLPFDLGKLEYYGFRAKYKLIDTLQCAKHLYNLEEKIGYLNYPLPNYKLQTFRYALFSKEKEDKIAKKYNIDIKAHNAISDVVILRAFFDELLKRVEGEDIEQKLEKLVELTKKPVLVQKFNFGKHKGKLLKDVLIEDRGYLEWLYNDMCKQKNQGKEVDENMHLTLSKLLEMA